MSAFTDRLYVEWRRKNGATVSHYRGGMGVPPMKRSATEPVLLRPEPTKTVSNAPPSGGGSLAVVAP